MPRKTQTPSPDPGTARVFSYLDGEMSGRERSTFEAKMASDPALARNVASWRALLGRLDEVPTLASSADFRARVLASLNAGRPWWARLRGRSLGGSPAHVPNAFTALLDRELTTRQAGALAAFTARDAEAAAALAGWRRLYGEMETLPRFAASEGFADRLMARVRVPQPGRAIHPRIAPSSAKLRKPAAARLRETAGRWIGSRWPSPRDRFAAASGLAFGPVAALLLTLHVFSGSPLVESRLDDSGEVGGVVETVRREARLARERIRSGVRRELAQAPANRPHGPTAPHWEVRQAARTTFDTLVLFAFTGLLVWLVASRARHRVGVVVRAVGRRPARCTLVGLAGAFAVIPAYLAGVVALVVTILGIPLLVVWLPLVPLAVAGGGFVGLVAVSHHVGRWVLGRGLPWLRWAHRAPPSDGKLLGLGTLILPFVAGEWLKTLPFAGWVGDLLKVAGAVGFCTALATGFGAVILTRGGTRPTRWDEALDDFGSEREDPGGWTL